MAIQNRRGAYSDFDRTKLVEGEWAVVKFGDPNSASGRGIYMGYGDGVADRIATEEDIEEYDIVREIAKANNIVGVDAGENWIDLSRSANLNSITAAGIYVATTAAAQTITNSPIKTVFKLIVERAYKNNNFLMQTIVDPYTGATWTRGTKDAGGTWSEWSTNLYAEVLGGGICIPENANLDDYINIGNYYIPLTATARTLQNIPTPQINAFTMKVGWATGINTSYIYQEIRDYLTGERYYRIYRTGQSAWIPWINLADRQTKSTAHIELVEGAPLQDGGCSIARYGNTVHCVMVFTAVTMETERTNVKIGTIVNDNTPSCRPTRQIRAPIVTGSYLTGYIRFDTDGSVFIGIESATNNDTLYATISYANNQ